MPDSFPVNGDTIIVDMIRKFPRSGWLRERRRGRRRSDRARNHSRTGRTGGVRRDKSVGMGR